VLSDCPQIEEDPKTRVLHLVTARSPYLVREIFRTLAQRPIKIAVFLVGAQLGIGAPAQSRNAVYVATAYSVTGITASGEWTHRHVVAADPEILPMGSRIRIKRAGRYSGEYVVADTGTKIQGRKLDIYMPSTAECKRFGSRQVRVRVLQLGDGTQAATKQADQLVKKEVTKDISKGVVGNAATDIDWKSKGAATAKAAEAGTLTPSSSTRVATPAGANPPNLK
jgi:3D (Asp-Asp-Asp) domain-containing protein